MCDMHADGGFFLRSLKHGRILTEAGRVSQSPDEVKSSGRGTESTAALFF